MQPRPGALVNLLVRADQTEGQFALVEAVVRRGEEPPLHSHTREDELIYVLEGDVTFYVDGKRLELTAGSYVLLPKGCEHAYCVESDQARLLDLLTPAGLERYYEELDMLGDSEPNIERLITVSARYGVEITGPRPWSGSGVSFAADQREGGDRTAQ